MPVHLVSRLYDLQHNQILQKILSSSWHIFFFGNVCVLHSMTQWINTKPLICLYVDVYVFWSVYIRMYSWHNKQNECMYTNYVICLDILSIYISLPKVTFPYKWSEQNIASPYGQGRSVFCIIDFRYIIIFRLLIEAYPKEELFELL